MTFEQTASAAGFRKILNGNHTITVEVSDGKETVSTSATFTKAVHAASVTLAEPLAVEGDITVAVLQVTGSIPDDAEVQGRGDQQRHSTASPVWQDATTEVKKGVNIVFENKTATGGRGIQFPRQRQPRCIRRGRLHRSRLRRIPVRRTVTMIQWKKDNLPTRQEKEAAAKKQQEHEQLPDRVAEMEDALCEQDAANEKRLTDIETALCELDAALNKE